ncbi:neutral/alkaline non-lysosomal ceramidase N-terminal domain-containing protein [Rhizobium sp. LC145]|uniref:neutral/alkaline non-lysosomal ceramidase N-terminal domain-containing protein n=1 Tax=Rhizobium sp. LC145 TaxID=1120688 RepID=UPI00062A2F63|nr:neutral/alkaline non-lysosomal ceramidase N-terminal domain-containing protein [Rhizobium sp. LC145]KKX33344.1 neutral/alkaline non-lysosomal ceramidase [Rhizobium sp. LC145]TKT43792.1 alkaline ceramidase [Rhizobiaceae bacterium LC148]
MIEAGAAVVDITPPPGLLMSGFAARSLPAKGIHDTLTARAVVIGDTAVVVADVIGIDAGMSARIRERCMLPAENVVVAALHNHGGPVSMTGRLSMAADPTYLERLEDACVAAIDKAAAARRPARAAAGQGSDPGVARNRRHPGGPVDASLPTLRIRDERGDMIAVITAYACHPVVLAADNLLWTADYPHFVRHALEEAYPGAVALFMTGCVGDANTGHSAHASITLAASAGRTYEAAERIGRKIAEAVLATSETLASETVNARNGTVALSFRRRETDTPQILEKRWREEVLVAEPARKNLLGYWADWARDIAPIEPEPLAARVTVLDWGGVPIVALPGEIFAQTALSIRAALGPERPAFVIGFADDNPGYIPPAGEFTHGGYEVDEAHRYYGLAASFAPGSAEALAACAIELANDSGGGVKR